MPIPNKTELRLTLWNLAVFAVILIAFSLSVFTVFVEKLRKDTRSDVQRLADAVVASVDFDGDKTRSPASAKPDLIASALPDSSAALLKPLRLEWFDYKGNFALQRGSFIVPGVPLSRIEGFQPLKEPRGILFTKPVVDQGRILGYVRVAQPLDNEDRAIFNLTVGLILGTLVALVASGAGTAVLVRQSILPLRRNMQQLRQFTADASHELRTPIMAIRTNSSVALKYPDGMRSGDKDKFEMILQSALQMHRLVEDLLLLGRAERSSADPGRANLLTVVQETCESLAWLAESKRTTVKIDVVENAELSITPDDLRRVVSNLVENAIHYTDVGGNVSIVYKSKAESGLLTVTDDGVGISPQDIDKVFDRFWRADKARNHDEGGQGLGLSIAKAIVERNGGVIAVTSEPGKGTVFSVSLKAAPVVQSEATMETAK